MCVRNRDSYRYTGAPEKGSVIRRKITDFLDDLTDAGRHLAEPAESPKMNASGEPGDAVGNAALR